MKAFCIAEGFHVNLHDITPYLFMSTIITPSSRQIPGSFNAGAIQERRPVIPGNYGLNGYGNLFYWAHAWSDQGGTIDLHPHQGFEIMSYVIEGSIEHFDTLVNQWKKLEAGDLQLIQAGSGVSHAERLNPGTSMFQIWFDPDLSRSMTTMAQYRDYRSSDFPVQEIPNGKIITYVGDKAPVRMESKIQLKKAELSAGKWSLDPQDGQVISAFMIAGKASVGDTILGKGDFFRTDVGTGITLEIMEHTSLFFLICPLVPGYRTYNQRLGTP